MKRRYVLAPQAARDLVAIWRYLKRESNQETADRIESIIRSKDCTVGGRSWYRTLASGFDFRQRVILPGVLVSHRLQTGNEAVAGGSILHGSRHVEQILARLR